MRSTKAIIFTHINVDGTILLDPAGFDVFYEKYGLLFESCLSCKNIALAFAYFSYGIEEVVGIVSLQPTSPVALPLRVIEIEERIVNALSMAVDRALDNLSNRLGNSFSASRAPKFIFVGVRGLASLLNKLWLRDPRLVLQLAGQGNFTYDSPKFVEAVIRLVRGIGAEARHPILRIDADVELNPDAVQTIIDQVERLQRQGTSYWWLSGCYSGNFPNDHVNEHAVRTHWLVTPATRNDPSRFTLLPGADTFLRDLAEFGATQVGTSANCSTACRALIESRGGSISRATPQVISGAGLVASVESIRRLPPFMNAQDMVVWIDDHLKRQLHEAIGDIPPNAPERIEDAHFKQDRYPAPDGIHPRDIQWASTHYFSRLLAGCLMHATIKQPNGQPGPLAHWVRQVVLGIRHNLPPSDEVSLRAELRASADARLDEVLGVWRQADYGNDILRNWAGALAPAERDIMCSKVVDMGVSYINLLLVWEHYVWAIQNLDRLEAYWLFTRVRS